MGRSDLAPVDRRYVEQWLERMRVQLVAEGLLGEESAEAPAVAVS